MTQLVNSSSMAMAMAMDTNSTISAADLLVMKSLVGDITLFWFVYVFVAAMAFAYSPQYRVAFGGSRLWCHAFPVFVASLVPLVVAAILNPPDPTDVSDASSTWLSCITVRSYPYEAYRARWVQQSQVSPDAAAYLFAINIMVFEVSPWLALIWPAWSISQTIRYDLRYPFRKWRRAHPVQFAAPDELRGGRLAYRGPLRGDGRDVVDHVSRDDGALKLADIPKTAADDIEKKVLEYEKTICDM